MEQVYIDYLNYDWDSFEEFQTGIKEILDNFLAGLQEQDPSITAIPALDKQQLIDQAKSFFYCSTTGNILNLDDFNHWKIAHGDKYNKNKKIEELEPDKEETQKLEQLDKEEPDKSEQEPPYSSNYQELVELIMSGKPVPGIKQIPDTTLPEQLSQSTAKQRVKPWEK